MVMMIYEILLFFMICFSFFLIQNGYLKLDFGTLTSFLEMFTGNLLMYYILLYHRLEYKERKKLKAFINLINAIIITISLIILVLLAVKLIHS